MIARRLRTISRSTLWLVSVGVFAPPIGATIGSVPALATPLRSMIQGGSAQAGPPSRSPQAAPPSPQAQQRAPSGANVAILGLEATDDPYAAGTNAARVAAARPAEPRSRAPRRVADTVDPWDATRSFDVGSVAVKTWLDVDTADPWDAPGSASLGHGDSGGTARTF